MYIGKVACACFFGYVVDGATGGAATGKTGVGAFGDFHLLYGKGLAGGDAWVAQAVHKHIVAGFKAANDKAVAKGVAAFTCALG